MMTADMIKQVRAGVFPVFVGQSEYQFNGAVYPLRVAPGFHYLVALLDTLTLRALEPVTVQNLLLALLGVGGAVSCYLCLAALQPARRWLAVFLAFLFISCPGVLGLPYDGDLYMAWTTVPLVPLVVYGALRSFQRMDWGTAACMAGGLGLMWWAHTPVAVWTTGFVVFTQIVRLASQLPRRLAIGWEAALLATFLAVAAYPLVSNLFVTLEPGVKMEIIPVAPETIAYFVGSVFPAVLLPMTKWGRELGDLQLGYSCWILWLCVVVWACVRRSRAAVVLSIASTGLVLLLTPVGVLPLVLWRHVPDLVRAITGGWAMNRLYLLLACLIVFGAWFALNDVLRRKPAIRFLAYPLLAGMCLWSGLESAKFAAGSRAAKRPPESGRRLLLPENIVLNRYAYTNFPGVPVYFTHSVTEPHLESRLLNRKTRHLLAGDIESIENDSAQGVQLAAQGEFTSKSGVSTIYDYLPKLTLKPGRHYGLLFNFWYPKATAILVMRGPLFDRIYAFPDYGEAKSFGAAPGHSHLLPIWTDGTVPEEIQLELRVQADWVSRDLTDFASFQLLDYDSALLPVQVTSLVPYRAKVAAPAEAWLETPRMYQSAYQAVVNGRRVDIAKSPSGLVMVPVPRGVSAVKVQYYPPFPLLAAFWVSFAAAWAVSIAAIVTVWWEAWDTA